MPRRGHSGRLRHEIRVYELDPVLDAETGTETPRWRVLHDQVPAEVTPMGESEDAAEDETRTQSRFQFVIRGGLHLTSKNRVGWRERWFNITGSQTDPEEVWTTIHAVEELKETP